MMDKEEVEETIEKEEVKSNSPFDHEPARKKAEETARTAAKQKKEMEKKLFQAIEKGKEEVRGRVLQQVSAATEEQKRNMLEHPEKVSENLSNASQIGVEKNAMMTAQSVMVDTVSKEVGNNDDLADKTPSIEDLSPAFVDAYKDSIRGEVQTDVAKDFEASLSNQSLERTLDEMSEEVSNKAETPVMDDKVNGSLNETLDQRSEWSTYREARDISREEADKAMDEIEGSAKRASLGNGVEKQDDLIARVSDKVPNMSEEARKKLEEETREADKKIKEAAQEELNRANVELARVQKEMAALKEEQSQIAREGSTIGIALTKGPVAAVDHFIRDAGNMSDQAKNVEAQNNIRAAQARLRDASR